MEMINEKQEMTTEQVSALLEAIKIISELAKEPAEITDAVNRIMNKLNQD
ncbi:MAG: hypothetical protein ACI4PP_03330 [Clostridia bacterium]